MENISRKIGITCMSMILLGSIGSPTIGYATTSERQSVEHIEPQVTELEEQELAQLANLSMEQLIDILKREGYDPYDIFSEEEIQQAQFDEGHLSRAGVTKIFL